MTGGVSRSNCLSCLGDPWWCGPNRRHARHPHPPASRSLPREAGGTNIGVHDVASVHLLHPRPSLGPDEIHIASDALESALRAVTGSTATLPTAACATSSRS